MPFLPPNQQRQSIEGNIHLQLERCIMFEYFAKVKTCCYAITFIRLSQ